MTKYERLVAVATAFIVAGFVGWIYETCIGIIETGSFDWDHGGIGIPFLQIYGFGAALIELLLGKEGGLREKPIPCFFAICLLTAVLEYGAGAAMLYGMGAQTWDYRAPGWDFLCTPDGLLCLRGVLSFAVLGIILLYLIDPAARKLRKMNTRVFDTIVWVLVVIIFASIVYSYAFSGTQAFK